MTALHKAARNGHEQMMELFLKKEIDINRTDR
jgi:ankyrin repeat protein